MLVSRVLVAVVGVLVLPSPALAADDLDYQGRTEQGKDARVQASAGGAVQEIRFEWNANRCSRPRGYLRSGTGLLYELTQPTTRLSLNGDYTQAVGDGVNAVVHTRGKARLSADLERWTGKFRVVAVLRADGQRLDKCRTPQLRWRAPLLLRDYVATGVLNIQSEVGDRVGDGQTESLPVSSGGGSVKAYDRGGTLNFAVGSWSGNLGVSPGALTPGTYTVGVDGATINVRGCCDDCEDGATSGTFTISEFVYEGRLVRAAGFSFEQHCFGSEAALRGDLQYHFGPPPLDGGPLSRSVESPARQTPAAEAGASTAGPPTRT